MNVCEFVDDIMAQLAPYVRPGEPLLFDMPVTVGEVDDAASTGAVVAVLESYGDSKIPVTRVAFQATMQDMGYDFDEEDDESIQ